VAPEEPHGGPQGAPIEKPWFILWSKSLCCKI